MMLRWSLLLALFVSTAHAASPTPEQIINNVAQEMAECAAYFGVVSVALENSNEPVKAEAFKKFMYDALNKAAIATKEAGLKEETVGARYNLAIKDMSERIGKNTSNISILMGDYDGRCIEAMTDVNKRIEFWRQRLSKP
jgi:hypothetical protein